ncbi:thymine dioxygenase [Coprinopsis cinerea AmutBmut pab1-1]|nr:thymine dioxygenase [Coprinopsis cinerea AmutBmut pab1-1]
MARDFPPFPDDIPTHPLLIVDHEKVKNRDQDEIEKLWEAATKLGFWYLRNHGCSEEADRMFDLGADVMALPLSEKMKYEQGNDGASAGYKAAGANAVDATGEPDLVEFLNVSKDDVLAWPRPGKRSYPKPATDRTDSTIIPFFRKCMEVNAVLLGVFEEKLGLPSGTLARRHLDDEPSGSEARITCTPPTKDTECVAIGGHTDFGSLTVLFNRLGGLQVLPPGSDHWQYVKPLAGHAICNVGDALTIFSGGILRSNLHRVLPPPGSQANSQRWSLAYFTRPGNSVLLQPLMDESSMISNAVNTVGETHGLVTGGQTAGEWFARRIKNQRLDNRKGPETWKASRGTDAAREIQ